MMTTLSDWRIARSRLKAETSTQTVVGIFTLEGIWKKKRVMIDADVANNVVPWKSRRAVVGTLSSMGNCNGREQKS